MDKNRLTRLDPRTRSPEPDDLTSETPPEPASRSIGNDPKGKSRDQLRPNPDVSAPHVPPAD